MRAVCRFYLSFASAFLEVDQKLENADPQPKAIAKSTAAGVKNFSLVDSIRATRTLEEALTFASSPSLSKEGATEILSKISEWTAIDAVRANDFNSDQRFIRVCSVLAKNAEKFVENLPKRPTGAIRSSGLDAVMSVAGDQQAAKICVTLPLDQNLQILSNLAFQKSRSLVVLRVIAESIVAHPMSLDLKQCSDVYFGMSALNFADEVLLTKLGSDVVQQLESNADKMAVVGSIITSLGMLRYRDANLLNALTKWTIARSDKCRSKDLVSLLMTLALLDFPTDYAAEIKSTILPRILQHELTRGEWLNYVWALCVLGLQQPSHLESVLK